MKITRILYSLIIASIFMSCSKEDKAEYKPEIVEESNDPISIYFRENFLNTYGTAVRWQWIDRYVDDSKRVTPAKRDVCIPMGDFIKKFWLEPFTMTEDGQKFMKDHFPPEIVFVGSPMYNSDGQSITLGYADAGARITFTQVNELDLKDENWILLQLRTAEHEFGHIVHQRHNLPNGYREVSPENYKSNNWINMAGDVQTNGPRISREAITAGMVSNYGTSDVQEDFCELLSIYITSETNAFAQRYLIHEPVAPYAKTDAEGNVVYKVDDEGNQILDTEGNPIPEMLDPAEDAVEMNEGRDLIAIKLNLIKTYYKDNFNIDLDDLRDEIMKRITEALKAE